MHSHNATLELHNTVVNRFMFAFPIRSFQTTILPFVMSFFILENIFSHIVSCVRGILSQTIFEDNSKKVLLFHGTKYNFSATKCIKKIF